MARFANLISRAIEREREEAAAKAAAKTDETEAAIHTTDGQAARVLQMPNRRSGQIKKNDAANDSKSKSEAAAKRDDWKWSEPPAFAKNLTDKGGLGAANSSPSPSNLLADKSATPLGSALEAVMDATVAPIGSSRLASRPAFRTFEVLPENVEPHLIAVTKPRSVHCEQFRNLRTQILHAAQRKKLQAITVASGSPGEGKSTVALNLAWLLAQTDGINALIIDSDLRLPCLADYLAVDAATAGLSEVFAGEIKLEEAIIRLEPSGLHLLAGGAPRDDVAEILSGNKFRNVLEQARKMFDFIIVDAPSLGIFTDAAVLINQTDAALLVVRAGKTRYGYTDRLLETLPRERMLGVVLNGSDEGLTNKEHYESYYNTENRKENSE
jgi:capsular exopolysaccharide synthesis family protein